ncbi:MAG: 3D domain-containing protein [Verrucomicrobiae bacterium]|nr:3D domain-containing protein [Verrucomicrobiae bacterium]
MPSAAPAYSSVPSATSTLESAQDLGYTIPNQFVVKTTAYTHYEADHVQYGAKTATGENLKYGTVRSAAADWSRYPVGTRFKIKGLPYEYVVDDYGRALVGTDTIDLYKPDSNYMNQWGARDVGIEVLEWGSFEESKRILEGRKNKPDADHVRRMLRNIEEKIDKIPAQLRDGFRA